MVDARLRVIPVVETHSFFQTIPFSFLPVLRPLMLFSIEIRDTSTSDCAVVQGMVLSAMAQDFYILLAKKNQFSVIC